jgi:trimeric autotransporter adhesin
MRHRTNLKSASLNPAWLLAALAGICLALLPAPNAFGVDPPPDGGYPNGNTVEGDGGLYGTDGLDNTALGNGALGGSNGPASNTAVGASTLGFNWDLGAVQNTAMGMGALDGNYEGYHNTAIGVEALNNGYITWDNTAVGYRAHAEITANYYVDANTAIGSQALTEGHITIGNTAMGAYALFGSEHFENYGDFNTAIGFGALLTNIADNNTAVGAEALYNNGLSGTNTAVGYRALFYSSSSNNAATGSSALMNLTSGANNTAEGMNALLNSTTGGSNTSIGFNALSNNTTGRFNIGLGESAGSSLTTGSNNIDIGNNGVAGEARTIRIGKQGTQTRTVIAGISGTTVAGGIAVFIDTNGRLGTSTSSRRYKEAIQPMGEASEVIYSLQPVTFRYKPQLDPEDIPQFGLVAEQVAKVRPDLVAYDDEGELYSVRYQAVNAMLLNEFQKDHRKVAEHNRRLAAQRSKGRRQQARLSATEEEIRGLVQEVNEQAAQIQKVSARLEANQSAMHVVSE